MSQSLYIVVYLLFALSLCFQFLQKQKPALVLLFACAMVLRLIAAHLDPFLHDWDEKYHAVVARNMMDHPFKPVLRPDPVMPYGYWIWTDNYIWLHKQPLFMWQMALSMKLFGVSEFAIRYPSVLMGALMVLLCYRISFLLTRNKNIAYLSALLMCFSNYQFSLTAGQGMDHNDLTFGFYVLASIWAYAEYTGNKSMKWVIWIGVFAGCAVLNKWLTGLLVYSGWALNLLLSVKSRETRKEALHLLFSLVVCCVVFLPWQIYIHMQFPVEATYEANLNGFHISEVIEGHTGDWLFYLSNMDTYFGSNLWIFLVLGLVMLPSLADNKKIMIALYTCFFSAICFFSFLVQTKMTGFIFEVVPLGFIFMAIGIERLLQSVPAAAVGKITATVSYIVIAFIVFDLPNINRLFSASDAERIRKVHNTAVYKQLSANVPANIAHVFNALQHDHVEIMFFNHGLNVYDYCIDSASLQKFVTQKVHIGILRNSPSERLPGYILNCPYAHVSDENVY